MTANSRCLGDRSYENVTLRGIAIIQISQNNATAAAALREGFIFAKERGSTVEITATFGDKVAIWWVYALSKEPVFHAPP